MKKALTIFLAVAVVILFVGISVDYAKDQGLKKGLEKNAKADCTTIQSGLIVYSVGHYFSLQPLMTGFDPFGYNYQGHMFSGSYTNSYLGGAGFPPWDGDDEAYLDANPTAANHWAWPYRDVTLMMKWNDAWISNTDCDGDGALDRHNGLGSYIGSGAWLTNHQQGTYIIVDKKGRDKECTWTYFTKIVAAPADATKLAGVWYAADGTEIGPDIWGQFATIQSVYNDPCGGFHGIEYLSPVGPGFGKFKPGK